MDDSSLTNQSYGGGDVSPGRGSKKLPVALVLFALAIILGIAGLTYGLYAALNHASQKAPVKTSQAAVQSIPVTSGTQQSNQPFLLQGTAASELLISGDTGSTEVSFADPTQANQIIMPNASGTVCLSSNNCNYITAGELAGQTSQTPSTDIQSLASQVTLLAAKSAVTSLQGETGDVSLLAGSGISISGTTIASTVNITSGNGNIAVTNNGNGSFTITGQGQSSGVALAPATAQTDSSGNSSIFINKTGSGNLLQLQNNGTNAFVVGNDGQTLVKTTTNSPTAFQVQNAAGTSLLNVDTSGSNVTVGNAGAAGTIQVGNTTGAVSQTINVGNNATTGSTTTLTVGSGTDGSSTTVTAGSNGLVLSTGNTTGNSGDVTLQSGNSSSGTAGNVTIDTGNSTPDGTVVVDKTFEDGTDGMAPWYGVGSAVQSSAEAHNSSYSLAVTVNDSGNPPAGQVYWGLQETDSGTAATPGHIYDVSAWVTTAATNVDNGDFEVVFTDSSDTMLAKDTIGTISDTPGTWKHITGSPVTAPAGTAKVFFQVESSSGTNGEIQYFDDLSITDVSDVSAPIINIGTANAEAVNIGNSSQVGATSVQGGAGGIDIGTSNATGIIIGSSSGGTLTLQGSGITQTISGSSDTIETTSNSATAFEVQNSSGTPLLTVDTSGSKVIVAGTLSAEHLSGAGTAPTLTSGTGAGTSPTTSVIGTDTAGQISVTTGGSPTAANPIVTLNFSTAYGTAPYVVFSPANANAAVLSGSTNIYVTTGTGNFSFNAGSAGLTAATQYEWTYHVIQ